MKKTVSIVLVVIILLTYPCMALGLLGAKISYSAAESFCYEWNSAYKGKYICDIYSENKDNTVDLIGIEYNRYNTKANCGISQIPDTASILVTYNTHQQLYDISFYDDALTKTLNNVTIYTSDSVLQTQDVFCNYKDTGLWMICFNYDTLTTLIMLDSFTIRAQVDGQTEYIDVSRESIPILYTMATWILAASEYSDEYSQMFMDSTLLPSSSVSTNNSQNADITYSFQTDYDAIDKAAESVFYVEIYNEQANFMGTASGFVAFDEHLFITNQHVIEDAAYLKIWDEKDNVYVLDKVIAVDSKYDLAILAFPDGDKYESLEMQLNASLKRGQLVTTIGSPKGMQNTVAFGNISSFPVFDGVEMIQFTAPISAGSSGGVLFDDNGKVIGVTSSGIEKGENIGFAIPIDLLMQLYKGWNKKRTVKLGTHDSLDQHKPVTNTPVITATPKPTKTPTPKPTKTPTPKPTVKSTPKPTKTPKPINYGKKYYIDLGKTEIQLDVGQRKTITPRMISLETKKELQSAGYTWSSSNDSIAKVNSEGVVTGVSIGTAVITCRAIKDTTAYSLVFVHVDSHTFSDEFSDTEFGALLWEYYYKDIPQSNKNLKTSDYKKINYNSLLSTAKGYKSLGLTYNTAIQFTGQVWAYIPVNTNDVVIILVLDENGDQIIVACAENYKNWTWEGKKAPKFDMYDEITIYGYLIDLAEDEDGKVLFPLFDVETLSYY